MRAIAVGFCHRWTGYTCGRLCPHAAQPPQLPHTHLPGNRCFSKHAPTAADAAGADAGTAPAGPAEPAGGGFGKADAAPAPAPTAGPLSGATIGGPGSTLGRRLLAEGLRVAAAGYGA
jgi:hypothetical protein